MVMRNLTSLFGARGAHGSTRVHEDIIGQFDKPGQRETLARAICLGLPTLVVWWVYGLTLPIAVYVAYSVLLAILHRLYADLRQSWSEQQFFYATLIHGVISAMISGMALWLVAQPIPELRLTGAVLAVGKLIHGLSAFTRVPLHIKNDNRINAAMIVGAGIILIDLDAPLVENVMIALPTLALLAYFQVAAIETDSDRTKMRGAAQASLNAKRHDAIGRLTAGVAHDFNNRLTAILGNLELYGQARTKAEEVTAIEAARAESEQAAKLVSQLLSFSRQARMEPDQIELGSYLEDLRMITARLFGKTTSFQCEARPDVQPVIADSAQLTATLVQLLVNARDAMPDGGMIVLEASMAGPTLPKTDAGQNLPAGAYVRIDIYDEGTGISAADLPYVTDPFYTTRKFGEAAGLGLSVAKGFAEQSGGLLEISSRPGHGTRVSLYLPTAGINSPVTAIRDA